METSSRAANVVPNPPPTRPAKARGGRPPRVAGPVKKRKNPAAAFQAPRTTVPPAPSVPNSDTDAAMEDKHHLFDELPESDPSSMHVMSDENGIESVNPTNETPLTVTPLVKKTRSRTGNYNTAEDEALVLAWENVGLDSITGTDQDGLTYWDRIADYYNRTVKSSSIRTRKSLQQRWGSIQECCNRWAGCMDSVTDNQPSGTTLIDLVPIAQELYKQKDKKKHRPFVMNHCWQLLKDNEKWRARNNESAPKKLKSCHSSSPDNEEEEEDDDDDVEEGRSPTPTSSRPMGRKQAKERVKKQAQGSTFKEVIENMMDTKKELEADKKKDKEEKWEELKTIEERKVAIELERLKIKKDAEERMKAAEERMKKEQDHKIMFMDTSSLDPQQLAYIESQRSEILSSVMNFSFNGTFNFGDGSSGSM